MEENKRVRGKGDAGRCTKQRSKKKYAGKRKSRKNKSKTNNINVLEDSVNNVMLVILFSEVLVLLIGRNC